MIQLIYNGTTFLILFLIAIYVYETEVIDMEFLGKMHIQNCMNCSVLKFNTSCPESLNFRERYIVQFVIPFFVNFSYVII
jgi:hypothetical protein